MTHISEKARKDSKNFPGKGPYREKQLPKNYAIMIERDAREDEQEAAEGKGERRKH